MSQSILAAGLLREQHKELAQGPRAVWKGL